MSTIKQNIPTFLNGISQQPDKKKIPTQLKDAINTYPDYALGMLKRPGGKFISNLINAENKSTTITSATHNGSGDASRTGGRYVAVATTGGTGSGATFNVHATVAGEVSTFTHNGVSATNRTAGTYYVANAAGSASGTGCDLKVIVDDVGRPSISLDVRATKTGGAGYNASGETITIADSSLGSGGAAAVVLTITAIKSLGVDVSLSSGGKGYVKGDTLSIADSVLGSGGGAAITVTVASTGTYGKWFSILRDENEKYVGQYADDTFRIWSLLDGSPRTVNMGDDAGVPAGCNYTNMQTDILAYNEDVSDTTTALTDLNTKQSAYTEANDGQSTTRISLWDTDLTYDTNDGTIVESIKSGIFQEETNNRYTIKKNGVIKNISAEKISGPVLTLERVSGGTGYSAGTAATTSSGDGTGLTVTYTVTGGVIDMATTVANAGGSTASTGYKIDEVVTIAGGGGNATFKVIALTWERGADKTSEHPHIASTGQKVYELTEIVAATHTSGQLSTANTNMGTAQTAYNNAVTAEASSKTAYNSEVTNCVIPGLPSNGYLRGASADDIELVTLNDYTYVLNKKKTVALKSDLTDPVSTDAFIVIAVTAYNSKYEVIINGVAINYTTAEDAGAGDADATVIVSNLVTGINGAGGAAASCVATAVGPGIHVTGVTSIAVAGGPQGGAIYSFINQISDLSLLPLQCVHNYKVKIINSTNIDADDMWVRFESGSSNYASGTGSWVESNEPASQFKLDPSTMPHQLVRETDGSFKFSEITWENRDVGDDVTNPVPSFVGSTIRNMFFFRNRFGFLSGGNVILSKAGSFYDFWAGSAMVAIPDDPIDISASSTKPVFLNYVKTASAGLVLFSDSEQFLLSTDSDILSPESAKVNTLSDYECDTDIQAINLGTSLAFISKTPLYSRLFELANISTTDPPTSFNTTGIVPELVPSTVDNIAGSPGMSIISLGTTGSSTLYQYRFYQTAEKRIASTWYKWDLTGNLIDQFFDVSTFYTVISDGTNVSIMSFDLRQASEEGFLTLPTGEKTDVCMDYYNTNPYRTYTSSTDITRVFLPFTHITGKTLAVVALGGYIGGTLGATEASVGAVLYPTVAGSAGSEYVDISGDYRGKNIIIGYIYTMTVDLPKFYYNSGDPQSGKADYTSDLVIHRVKVSTGLSGPVKYNVNLTGIPDRSQTVSAIMPYTYTANDVAMAAEGVHEVPVYQRNENISFSIVGDTPLPVSLLGMTWEGKYNNKFYSHV